MPALGSEQLGQLPERRALGRRLDVRVVAIDRLALVTDDTLNAKWDVYYQPSGRAYRPHEYLGIYYGKSVRYVGRIVAVYDNSDDGNGGMVLTLPGLPIQPAPQPGGPKRQR